MDLKLGIVLSEILNERKITLREISQATGVATSTLGEWTNNRRPRNIVSVKKVALYLGVSLNFLLFGELDEYGPKPSIEISNPSMIVGTYEITLRRVLDKTGKSQT